MFIIYKSLLEMNDSFYKFLFNKYNILNQSNEVLQIKEIIQKGGFEELKYSQVIDLWQNPHYKDKFINFYAIVNVFLRGFPLDIKYNWLQILNLQSKNEFMNFIIYYVNKLTNIIYKNVSTTKNIFFRGEARKYFNYKIGDTIFFSTFQSVSSSISIAYEFANSKKHLNILFVMEIPSGYYYKELNTHLKFHNNHKNITTYIDEQEFLIMPNSYYIIVDIFTIYNNVSVVKLRMFKQDYFQIQFNKMYEPLNYTPKTKDYSNFNSHIIKNFIKKTEDYKKMIDSLISLENYNISQDLYKELNDCHNNDLFNLDTFLIRETLEKIDDYNIKDIAEEIRKYGLGYYTRQIKTKDIYKERIEKIIMLKNMKFNSINYLPVFVGFYNIDKDFQIPQFIQFLKKQNINQEFIYSKIIITQLKPDKFLYDDIYNDDYPRKKIKYNNKTKIMYYKHLIKFKLNNTPICVCDTHKIERQNNVILIPNFKMKLIKKTKLFNKYDLPYILYEISIL
jgi:hypothetical protein